MPKEEKTTAILPDGTVQVKTVTVDPETSKPVVTIINAPINRQLEYLGHKVTRFNENEMCIIQLTTDSKVAGKKLDDRLKGRWTTIEECLKAIDNAESNKRRMEYKVTYDYRGPEFLDIKPQSIYN